MLRAKFSMLDKVKSGGITLHCSHEQLYVYVLSKGDTCLCMAGGAQPEAHFSQITKRGFQ